ncbi:mediator complex subunit Med5-domain-containing protein [Phakopsora pachyrhizi]|nr:mediator complex subunit Med5-domain-containing protein [Phakopsora pachyrhizi]
MSVKGTECERVADHACGLSPIPACPTPCPGTLISLFTSINPPSSRLLSYYRIAVKSTASDDPSTHLILASDAAIAILRWISNVCAHDHSDPQTAHLGLSPSTILGLADILSDPILVKDPRLSSHQPIDCLINLSSLLDSFYLCQTVSSSVTNSIAEVSLHGGAVFKLTEQLLTSLAPSLLSLPPSSFLKLHKTLDPLLKKLYNLLSISGAADNGSPAILSQLPTILRHLSPSLAQKLAFESSPDRSELNSQKNLNDLQPSTRASSIIAHTLLTPGSSALKFDEDGKEIRTPLVKRMIGFVTYHAKSSWINCGFNSSHLEQQRSWIFDLFLAAIRIGNTNSSYVFDLQASREMHVDEDESIEDDKVGWKALLGGGRLAELIRFARANSTSANQGESLLKIEDLEILRFNLIGPETLLHQKGKNEYPDVSMEDDGQQGWQTQRNQLWFALLTSICSNQLIKPQDLVKIEGGDFRIKSLGMIQGHHSGIDLGVLKLAEFMNLSKDTSINEIALATKQAMSKAASAFDLSACISLSKELTSLDTLCSLFIWLEPNDILSPIAALLDDWGSARSNATSKNIINEGDGSSEFEKFGSLVGWIQGIVGRFGLMSNLDVHLGRSKGFTIHYLLNPSCAYSLKSLPANHVSTLSSWIVALYGSSGISDDLLVNTDPRVFYTISASLFKQSFDGLRAGLIDLQTFREGLSYFEQDLLVVGCAVGLVGWLVDELSRVGPVPANSYPTALLEILQAFLLSDSITPTAIQLVAAKSLRLLRCFNSYFISTQATQNGGTLETPMVQDYNSGDLNRRVHLDITRIENKLTAFPSSSLFTPTGYLSYNFFNVELLVNYGVGMGWEEALNIALRMAITDEVLDFNEHPLWRNNPARLLSTVAPRKADATIALWSILPPILNSMSIEKFVRIVILAISAGIRAGEDSLSPPEPNRIGVRVAPGWNAAKYKRVGRAIELAIDVFTWPFEQVGCHYFNRVKRPPILKNLEQDQNLIEGRSKLVGAVLEEVLVEWGKRIAVQEIVEDAELERDIVIGCLDRLTDVETASLREEELNIEGNLNISNFYRSLCIEGIKQEIENMEKRQVGVTAKRRGFKILSWIQDSLKIENEQLVGVIS